MSTKMNHEAMKKTARERVEEENPKCTEFDARKVYPNILEGTVVTVFFKTAEGKEDSNQIYFGPNEEVRRYRWMGDVLSEVSTTRERVWFFRFIELAGIGGLIAFILVVVFSVLLCLLAFFNPTVNPTILEVVKTCFTIILGFFFGSQSVGKRAE